MNLKQYIIIMLLGTLFCWIAWIFVILNIDPFQDTGVGFLFFYISFTFALLGTISIFSFLIRQSIGKNKLPMFRYVKQSFKDALFFTLVFILLLFLQGKGYLNWWNTIIFNLVVLLSSIFILSNKTNNNHINFK